MSKEITVALNPVKLGLRGRKLDVLNALTNTPVAITPDGKVSLKLGSEEWVYIWLRPKSGQGG